MARVDEPPGDSASHRTQADHRDLRHGVDLAATRLLLVTVASKA
jgi:hypothetical protein